MTTNRDKWNGWKRFRAGWRRLNRRGIAALELAIIGPVLVLLLCGIYDLGFAIWQTSTLNQALQAAANYALANPGDTTGILNTVVTNLGHSLPAIGPGPTVSTSGPSAAVPPVVTETVTGPGGTATVTVTPAGNQGTCLCVGHDAASPQYCSITTYPDCTSGVPESYMRLTVTVSINPLVLATLTQTSASYVLRTQ